MSRRRYWTRDLSVSRHTAVSCAASTCDRDPGVGRPPLSGIDKVLEVASGIGCRRPLDDYVVGRQSNVTCGILSSLVQA